MTGSHGAMGRRSSGRGRLVTILLVVAGMAIAFVAGAGAAYFFKGGNTGGGGATGQNSPAPCVTTTTVVGAGLPKPSQVQLNVYNAAHISGIARRTGTALEQDGFVVLTKTNDPLGKSLSDVGEIRYGPSGAKGATLLLAYVRGARLVNDGRSDATIDLAIGRGFVALSTPTQVLQALSKPVKVVTGSGCSTG